MVSLIALFPAWIMWAPNAIWKAFDLFVGLIQAFIFAVDHPLLRPGHGDRPWRRT